MDKEEHEDDIDTIWMKEDKVALITDSRGKKVILGHQDLSGSGSDMISLCTCVCVCCVVIQVGVLDTGRGSRLVIR